MRSPQRIKTMMWPSIALLTFVTLQRLAELVLARRNTAALLARGAREVAPEHYLTMMTPAINRRPPWTTA